MRIIIAGINGFIGSRTAQRLIEKGHSVVGIGRQSSARSFVPMEVDYQCFDVQHGLPELDADAIIHCVGSPDDHVSFEELFQRNVVTTKHLVKASKNIPKFIYISTSSVYYFGENKMFENDTPDTVFNKLSPYGRSKILAEKVVRSSRQNQGSIILRPRIVYGKGDRLILPRLLRLVRFNRLLIPTHLTTKISLTHIENLLEAIELALLKETDQTGIYNICDKEDYSLQIVLPKLVQAAYAKPLKVLKIPSSIWNALIRLNAVFRFSKNISSFGSKQITSTGLVDSSKAKKELGYTAHFHVSDSFPVIAAWVNHIGGWKSYRDNLLE